MPYDLFVSYSRRDNRRGQVTALKAQIESSFRAFAGRDLRVFFDTHEIAGMDDWRQKIQRCLRDSQVFLAVLSPHYLASPYCRLEWEDYVRYEAMRQCLGEGVAPVFFVTLPNAADPQTDQALALWIDEIQRRQSFDLCPWHDAGEHALQLAHVRQTLEFLHASVRERLDRAQRSRNSQNNLIKHNPAFVGRLRELTELRNALTKNKLGVVGAHEGPSQPSTINSQPSVVVQGLGGMGKTELALAYAHAFAWDYPGGRWQIPCENVSDLRVALLHLATATALNFEFTENEKKSIVLAFERVLRELSRRDRCLLILDNVSDANLLQPEYMDRLPRDGRADLIATTRLAPRAIPGSAQEQSFIAVDELPEEDALALMRSHQSEGRFASQQEDDDARAIVRLLRGFTLAVETAAIYLGRDTAPNACHRFRERLSPDLLGESETAATNPAVAVRHRVRSLEETLALTLQTLTSEALHLLGIASLLPADQIAVSWLKTVGAEQFSVFIAESTMSESTFCQAEELLFGLRLLQPANVVDNDGRLLVARMHRLVQQLVAQRRGFEKGPVLDGLVGHAEKRCTFVVQSWVDWGNRWEIEPLRAFAEQLLTLNHPRASYVTNEVVQPLYHLGRYAEAEALMRRALELDKQSFGPDHPGVAVRLSNLAALLQDTNRLSEAEPLLQRALAIIELRFGPEHPEVARILNNLASLYQECNRPAEAELLLRRGLAIEEKARGVNHPFVAIKLNNLARLLQTMNRLEEAAPLLQRALTISETYFGENHPNVATILSQLATLLRENNRPTEAEPLFRRALAICEQCFGADHPSVATDLNNLAVLLLHTNRPTAAEPLLRRGLAIFEKVLGADHPSVVSGLTNLAHLLQETNRLEEAQALLQRALAIAEQSFGPEHPNVGTVLGSLAALLAATNRLADAEPLLRRALAMYEQSFGQDHPNVAAALNNLGLYFKRTNRLPEAEPLLRRALEIRIQAYGPNHPDVAQSLNSLAGLLRATDRATKAEALYRRALAIDEQNFGSDHPSVATGLNNLAQLLQAGNRLAEADSLMRRVLEIYLKFTRATGHPHLHLPAAVDNYAKLLHGMGKSREHLLAALREIGPELFNLFEGGLQNSGGGSD